MFKRFLPLLALLVLGATVALAESTPSSKTTPVTGAVVEVQKEQVRVVVKGDLPAWIKKGGKVRLFDTRAFVVEIAADTLTLSTKKADKAKVGDEVKLLKPRPGVAGC
jgi:hypothetical protein